ncbi:MAG: MBL fold metallo-hydrolase [Candidatus Limnocylindrales bacterium]
MERLTDHVHAEVGLRGSNHGYVATSDGVVLIDTPFKPSDALRLGSALSVVGPLRYVINTEPHIDHWTGNAYLGAPVVAHDGVRRRILTTDVDEHRTRIAGLGPDEAQHASRYQARLPSITFSTELTLHVGDQELRLINMPGHTQYQAAVLVVGEGVVFTSDNVFSGVHTWLQEADPDAWLRALESLRALDADILVPGHGRVCGKAALDTQASIIGEWVGYVGDAVDRGMSRDDAMDTLTAMTDRFPMDVEQDGLAPRVMRMNVANLFDYLTGAGIHAPASPSA